MTCHSNCSRHCCVFKGVVCPYLEAGTIQDKTWACGLLRELGTWKKVLLSASYKKEVAPLFESVPEFAGKGYNCENYPQEFEDVLADIKQDDCGWFEG